TLQQLTTLVQAGGRVIASGDVPSAGQRGTPDEGARAWAALSDHGSAHHLSCTPPADDVAGLLGDLTKLRPFIDTGAAQVWQWAGLDRDGWRLAALNDSDDWANVLLRTPFDQVAMQICNPADGSIQQWRTAGSGGSVELRLAPNQL